MLNSKGGEASLRGFPDCHKGTLFRHYADKREVLFGGAAALRTELLRVIEELPPALPAIEAARIASEAMSSFMRRALRLPRARTDQARAAQRGAR